MELFLTVQLEEAADALEQALRCYEELGIRSAKGAALSFLAQLRWQVGSLPEGLATASNALEELDGVPGSELVGAYAMMAALQLAAEDLASAMTWAKRAENLAGQLDRLPSRILALQMVGWVEFLAGTPGGVEKLASTLELGLEAGLEDVVAVTYDPCNEPPADCVSGEPRVGTSAQGSSTAARGISTSGAITCSAGRQRPCSPMGSGRRRLRRR
jgi:hypothetical protein